MMKRAARRRKRNKPPGPCGVLWEMSKSKVPPMLEEEEATHPTDKKILFEEAESTTDLNAKKKRSDDQLYDMSMPIAWQAMQRSMEIATPYLPLRTRGNIAKRYELLRPHLPSNCILLPEILNGNHDLKISDQNSYLCAWVDSVEERNSHHGIWTVELKDETGATIRAWMEPNFVKEELQKTQKAEDNIKGVVRVGVVWMLSGLSMIAIANGDQGVERMLVVSGKRIQRVWTPESDKALTQPNEEEDSPEAQRKYLDWMEKRNAITIDDESPNENDAKLPENETEDEMDEEELDGDCSHRNIVGGKEGQERMTALSALTMTADDENLTATSQHSTLLSERNIAAIDKQNQPQFPTTSPLADRSLNRIDSSRVCNNNTERNDESQLAPSALLQTQESTKEQERLLQGDRPSTQLSQSLKSDDSSNQGKVANRSVSSSRALSPCKDSGHNASQEMRKRKKSKKTKDFLSPSRKSPKRRKRGRSSSCSSPIRMSQSVWNTPDPSILQMLEDDSDDNANEGETPTVIGTEPSLSYITTQGTNKMLSALETTQLDNGAISVVPGGTPGIKDDKEKQCSDEPLLLTGKALMGENLFEPSKWKGVDSTAFSESDSE